MKKEKNKTINSDAAGFLKSWLHPSVTVVDMFVVGKWLKAELSSNISFSVRNRSVDTE